MGLRDLRIGDRYLLCADGPGPAVDDRTHFYVLTLRAISADALASSPAPAAGRASVSRLTPYRWARACIWSKPAPGSRSLLRMRAADQPRYRVPRDARWHVRRRCRARCAGVGSPEPSGLRTSSKVRPEGLGVNDRQEKELLA